MPSLTQEELSYSFNDIYGNDVGENIVCNLLFRFRVFSIYRSRGCATTDKMGAKLRSQGYSTVDKEMRERTLFI